SRFCPPRTGPSSRFGRSGAARSAVRPSLPELPFEVGRAVPDTATQSRAQPDLQPMSPHLPSLPELPFEVVHGPLEALVAADLRLPPEQLAGPRDVRLADLRVVLRQRLEDDPALAAGELAHLLRELQNGDLGRVAEVDRVVEVGPQQPVDALDEVGDVAEAAGLLAVAVDGDRLAPQRLVHEVRQHPAVVEAHPLAVGVKDADDVGIEPVDA